ncbi:hypothetical protein CK203_100439 [Vitis vinifera]|uniref:Uncharacterized protein n=1 Tax=Vitis vinifera TaxID=29760 RepID=A0A438CJ85_VITVI|nr:hypothetical protein CK203_100439 [Vitis vinifera]
MMEELLGQVNARILDIYSLNFKWNTSTSKRSKEEKQTMEKRKTEDSSCSLLSHFGALSEVHFLHTIYHFKALEVKNPTLKPCTIWSLNEEDMDFGSQLLQHPEVISYELLEGEVFNSKFCINPLEQFQWPLKGEFITWNDFELPIFDPTVKEANLVPIILGRPFLATSNAIINCRNGLMQLTFGNMTLDLNIFYMSKKQITPEE